MKKSKMFSMRFTEADFERIKRSAEKSRLDMTGYITAAALDRKIVVIDGLDQVVSELKGVGRNLNQLTTLCNMGKIKCPDLNEAKRRFGEVFDAVYALSGRGRDTGSGREVV